MDTNSQEQTNNRPWLYKKGQSGNPGGRPKGSISMKEWVKRKLLSMTDEEREVFMEGLSKDIIWKMAEGNPDTSTDLTSGGKPIPIYGGLSVNNDIQRHNSNQEDIQPKQEN